MDEAEASDFLRWAMPAAAGIALGVGLLWWSITLRQETKPLAKLRDGGQKIVIDGKGDAAFLRALPAGMRETILQTLRTGRIAFASEVKAFGGAPAAVDGLRLLVPVATAVRDGQPAFRWTAAASATAYRVTVMEETSGDRLRSEDVPAPQTEWRPAEPLPLGQVYDWTVVPLREGAALAQPPAKAGSARFQVLPMGVRAELEEWLRLAGESHLLRGMAEAHFGLRVEAAEEFQELARENPDSSLVRRLLEQVTATTP